jgi:DNA primase large subunit
VLAEHFIKVPFKDALSLVSNKQVFLKGGIAFVHKDDLNTIARSQFRAKLMSELSKAYKFLPTIMRDARLSQLLINLSNHNSIDFNLTDVAAPKDTDKIRLSDLDYYSRKSFPPCMKVLYTALKNNHHLKHFGRLQLGLFLKGLGFTMEEAM